MGDSAVIVRPYGLVIEGRLELGLELVMSGNMILEIRRHSGVPEPVIVSPAFVNAHSHLEYRGLMGRIPDAPYWPWIREITRLKPTQAADEVRADIERAAEENVRAGVAWIAEHSDRPGSGEAMRQNGLGGMIFQEVITLGEADGGAERLEFVRGKAEAQREAFGGPVYLSPHAPWSVDPATLEQLGRGANPLSIHVAETELEDRFLREGAGPMAELLADIGGPIQPTGEGVVEYLRRLGLVRPGAQFVHGCALDEADLELMAEGGVSVAHCPRSNAALGCPIAPVRQMLEAGIPVGLGLDSAASSGPIDMLAEMAAALHASETRREPLRPEVVWRLATDEGARSVGIGSWGIAEGSTTPLIEIDLPGAYAIREVIESGARVRRVTPIGSSDPIGQR